ncbi:hypothetical protein Pelo_13113 [Pelomyxa schiedti]|nr:hypothetical protein Pelo_13113 [Pelomyxa schiedti]
MAHDEPAASAFDFIDLTGDQTMGTANPQRTSGLPPPTIPNGRTTAPTNGAHAHPPTSSSHVPAQAPGHGVPTTTATTCTSTTAAAKKNGSGWGPAPGAGRGSRPTMLRRLCLGGGHGVDFGRDEDVVGGTEEALRGVRVVVLWIVEELMDFLDLFPDPLPDGVLVCGFGLACTLAELKFSPTVARLMKTNSLCLLWNPPGGKTHAAHFSLSHASAFLHLKLPNHVPFLVVTAEEGLHVLVRTSFVNRQVALVNTRSLPFVPFIKAKEPLVSCHCTSNRSELPSNHNRFYG